MSIDGDVNIVIADDSPFIRTAYQRILETQYNFSVVAVAEDGEQAIEKVTELQPDVLVIDVIGVRCATTFLLTAALQRQL